MNCAKIDHTPFPWTAMKHTDTKGWTVSAGNSVASVKPRPQAEGNATLMALATTAPHECGIADCPGVENKRLLDAHDELVKALTAAWAALRSYQYGNASTVLAETVGNYVEGTIARAEGRR